MYVPYNIHRYEYITQIHTYLYTCIIYIYILYLVLHIPTKNSAKPISYHGFKRPLGGRSNGIYHSAGEAGAQGRGWRDVAVGDKLAMIHQQTWMVIWLRQSGWEKFYVTLIIPWSQGRYFENVVALGPALLCCPSGPIRMKGLECCRMLRQGLRLKLWFLHFHCTQFWFPITILVHSRVADRTLKWTWTAMGRFEPFWTWESSIFFRLFTWFEYVVFTGHEVYKKTRIDPKIHEVWKPGMNHHRKFCPQMSRAYFHQATEIHSAFFLVPMDNRDVQRWCTIIYPDIPDISGVDSRPRSHFGWTPATRSLKKAEEILTKAAGSCLDRVTWTSGCW